MQILTATSLFTARKCLRQYWYRFELGLMKERVATPLRLGKIYHKGLELIALDVENAASLAVQAYDPIPDWAEPVAWAVERETVRQLILGHAWRYTLDGIRTLATEFSFDLPLINPATNKPSRTFRLGGKIDQIARLSDERMAIIEYKTTGFNVDPDSDLWTRLRYDPQISMYVYAASQHFDTPTTLYDVVRKPSIRPKKVNGSRETPEEYGVRLAADMQDRPDFYFARREIVRLHDDIEEFRHDLWQQAETLKECKKHNRWYRNVSAFTCDYCAYKDICLSGTPVDMLHPPEGYVITDPHPELKEK